MHVLLFDIDGTLIHTRGAGRRALERAITTAFGVPVRGKVDLHGRTDRGIVRDYLAGHGLEPSDENWHRLRAAYLEHLPDTLAESAGEVLPGIADLLERLGRRSDVVLGILTGNMRAGADAKLGHFGLTSHFVCGGYGDDHHDRDDVARGAMADALRYLGPRRFESVWVLGDTPHDIRCARAIEARVVAVLTGGLSRELLESHTPDLLLNDLGDPTPFLDLIPELEALAD